MNKRAFTLIELLVVIVIIGLLTTVATTSFLAAQRNSRDDERKTGVNALANALEAYKLVHQTYPGTTDGSDVGGSSGSNCVGVSVPNGTLSVAAYYDPSSQQYPNGCTPSASFLPAPNWIPGLGNYLNPAPIEPRYVDSQGGSTGTGTFDVTGSPTGSTRTFSYQKTTTGYYVHAMLEAKGGTVYTVSK